MTRYWDAVHRDGTGGSRVGAEQCPQQARPAGADQARQAHDLTTPHGQGHIRHEPWRAQPLHRQPGRTRGLHGRGRPPNHHASTEHPRDQQLGGDVQDGSASLDHRPVSQHGHPVGDAEHLGQPVADVQHRGALRRQSLDDPEQLVEVPTREDSRGFVHDEHPGRRGERLGDLDELLLGHR